LDEKTESSLRVYVDSSALLKRVLEEPESDALDALLLGHIAEGDTLVSSALAWVEVHRVIRGRRESADPRTWITAAAAALSGIDELAFDEATLSLAHRVGPSSLRSLDAIHLAAAIQADVDLLVSYDDRLIQVSEEMGIETVKPV
jgi:predicted nucleic acid-binding protein